ncbi:MAG: hypothetical protein ACXVAU_17795, partial [Mucilaginibacter sp.]
MDNQTLQNKPGNTVLIMGVVAAVLLMLGFTIILSHEVISPLERAFYSRFIYWGTVAFLFLYAWQVEHQPMLIWTESKVTPGFFLASVLILYLLFIAAAIVSAIPMLFGLRTNNDMVKRITDLFRGHSF